MARKIKQPRGRWLKLRSGAVYAWSESLAKASGAYLVSAQEAADWFRSIGGDNEITRKYPPLRETLGTSAEDEEGPPEDEAPAPKPRVKKVKPRPRKAPAGKLKSAAGKEPTIAVSDKPATPKEIQDMIDGHTDSG